MRDDRTNAARAGSSAIGVGVIALVGQRDARANVGADVQQGRELPAVARLAAGQMEGDRQAGKIGLEMDLGREPAARTAERLAALPPFAPAAEKPLTGAALSI
jgi:hypothetical protein